MVAKNAKSKQAKAGEQPAHGASQPANRTVGTRGRSFVGTVTSDRMSKTVVVSWTRRFFVKKFERYERRLSKVSAHNPDEINAKKGDVVRIVETRPLSKTKHFIVTEIIGKETAKAHLKTEATEEAEEVEAAAKTREEKSDEE